MLAVSYVVKVDLPGDEKRDVFHFWFQGSFLMEAYWCHGVQKNRHILTAPEEL